MFKTRLNTDRQLYYQRIATRIHIVCLSASIIVLCLYSAIITVTHSNIIYNPTEEQYVQLQSDYSNRLTCPCKTISMNYSTFIYIKPSFHQLCSSDLVSQKWKIYNSIQANFYYPLTDYGRNAAVQFETLKTLCEQAQNVVVDALKLFLETHLVSSNIISPDLFDTQMSTSIRDWKSATINQFLVIIQLIQTTTKGNLLMNGDLNSIFLYNSSTRDTTILSASYSNCTCARFQSCYIPMALHDLLSSNPNEAVLFTLPTFLIGCFPVDALLASTLECFYDLSCMQEIDRNRYRPLGNSFNFSALDPTLNSPNETIQSIVQTLMIDKWVSNVSYISYFNTCAPSHCSYEYTSRNTFLAILIKVIGIFGGLSLALKLITLLILQLIYQIIDGFTSRGMVNSIKKFMIPRDEERIINRLHIILMVIFLIICYTLIAFTPKTITVEIQKPTLSNYIDLLKMDIPDTIQCSCRDTSIKYETFFTMSPKFHEVCSSDFVGDLWIDYLYGEGDLVLHYTPTDFRYSAYAQFQLLSSLCQLSKSVVNDTLALLLTSNFISTQLLPSNLLNEKVQKIVNERYVNTPDVFVNMLALIREMTSANKIMSILSTNWIYFTPPVVHDYWSLHAIPLEYDGCNCGITSKCVHQLDGLLSGCYPLEALLQTKLFCFYDQQCIDSTNHFRALNVSSLASNHFPHNDTIESLVNKLMIDEYSMNISYENYFNQCSPSSCIYTYIDRTNTIDAITNIVSLYGGLVIISRVVAVITVKIFLRHKFQIHPNET